MSGRGDRGGVGGGRRKERGEQALLREERARYHGNGGVPYPPPIQVTPLQLLKPAAGAQTAARGNYDSQPAQLAMPACTYVMCAVERPATISLLDPGAVVASSSLADL